MHLRALGLIAASILAIALTGIAYLHPSAAGPGQARMAAVATSGYQLAAVDFVNATSGWVAATLDTGTFAVLHTGDAGESWSRQLRGTTDQRTVYLRFFDSRHGMLGLMGPRPAMFLTADGGSTWSLRPMRLAPYLLSMSFVDPDHGWLLVETGELFRTVDAGATWARLGMPVPSDAQAFRVQFIDRAVGWLDTGSSKPVAYKSVDGGVTWRPVPLPAPGGAWPTGREFFVAAQPTRGAGVVATVVNLPPLVGRLRSGEQVVAYPPLTVRSFDGGLPVRYSYSIFADAIPGADLRVSRSDQVSSHQVELSSLDGGATWIVVSPPSAAGAVGYADAQTWWWIGSGAGSTSYDGGSTWTPTRNLGVIQPLPGSLQVLDSSHAWFGAMAGGIRPMLERTADAGLHWEMLGLPSAS
jgi:hypothetical protein